MEQVNLNKQVFADSEYKKVIDTSFTQLITPPETTPTPTISIAQFFQNYQELFYLIPKFGDTNSHEYLVKTSSNYIGITEEQNEEIQALINEITTLRQSNLELNQQLVNTKLSNG
jgi:hypothetical protein